jgi:superfamily II DNA/RNA helicase
MKVPKQLLAHFKSKRIFAPTPIQTQGLPTAFSGRDMIGIAFTGSGKTLTFCLPLIMLAMEEEAKLPFQRGEGPVGIILCPSVCDYDTRMGNSVLTTLNQRELANQTYENVVEWTDALAKASEPGGRPPYPRVRTLLCIGGINMSEQSHVMGQGFHIVVATPGRLMDMLEKRKFTLDSCRYLCMDEADRMIDLGFEEDVRTIMGFFKASCCTFVEICLVNANVRFVASTTNAVVLCNNAPKDPRLCSAVVDPTHLGQCWSSWCCQFGRLAGRGVCQAGGENGLPARMFTEDTASCHYF